MIERRLFEFFTQNNFNNSRPTHVLLTLCFYRIIFSHMKQFGATRVTPYTFFTVRWNTFFLVNRVEHQKLNQTTAELSFG